MRLSVCLSACLLGTLTALGCVTDHARTPAPVVLRPARQSAAEVGEVFAARGPQPGEHLRSAWVMGLDGRSVDLRALGQGLGGGEPFVVITASLTSPAARRSQAGLELLQQRYGSQMRFFTLYTIEAHPAHARSPYSGTEWIPPDNIRESALVRQPTIMLERMELAREYQRTMDVRSTMLVDPMDNVGWRTLGMAPNLALLVDADGVVIARQGWFDPMAMQATIGSMLGELPPAAPGALSAADHLPPGLSAELVDSLTSD
jgi:hypothetical protein